MASGYGPGCYCQSQEELHKMYAEYGKNSH